MELFYAACAGITTIAIVLITIYLIMTLKQFRKTHYEIERAAKNLNNHLEATKDLLKTFNQIGETVGSVWLRGLKYLIAAATGFSAVRKNIKSDREF
jgi:uncharacterized protein YoxC